MCSNLLERTNSSFLRKGEFERIAAKLREYYDRLVGKYMNEVEEIGQDLKFVYDV